MSFSSLSNKPGDTPPIAGEMAPKIRPRITLPDVPMPQNSTRTSLDSTVFQPFLMLSYFSKEGFVFFLSEKVSFASSAIPPSDPMTFAASKGIKITL